MTLLDRHVFREWAKVFLLAAGAALGLLLMHAMYDDLGDFIGSGAGFAGAAVYFLVLMPSFLPAVLPVALLISLLFSLGKMHRDNEITAMRACGLSLWRITRALWLAGIALAAALFALNAKAVPWSVESARRIYRGRAAGAREARPGPPAGADFLHNLTFYNRQNGRVWFINRYSENLNRAFGVTVSILDESGREISRLAASEAVYERRARRWTFNQGRETRFDPLTGEPARSCGFEEKTLGPAKESPVLMATLRKRPKDLSLPELKEILEALSPERHPLLPVYAVEYHAILANPAICLIMVGFAVPFAVAGVRVSPFVGVSKSIGLFLLYYLAVNLCHLLGGRAALPSMWAAWLPNGLMLLLALFFCRKAA